MSLNFIHIGQMKSGTTWVYKNYFYKNNDYADIKLKEFRLFDRVNENNVRKKINRINDFFNSEKENEKERKLYIDYLNEATPKNYLKIFDYYRKPTYDISPAYSGYNIEQIKKLSKILPTDIKIIFNIRNPINRTWSHYHHYLKALLNKNDLKPNRKNLEKIIGEIKILDFLKSGGINKKGFATRTIDKWNKIFNNIIIVHFDDFLIDKNKYFRNLHSQLLNKKIDDLSFNKIEKQKSNKLKLNFENENIIREYFKDELVELHTLFPEKYNI